ncbi:MAG: ABC transporter ATP-binding protein [Candidatus Caldarchaeum sp.]
MSRGKVLRALGMTKKFGGVTAVDNVDIEVGRCEIVGLIGPNGAGKTTLLSLISGLIKPDSGYVELEGVRVTGLRPHVLMRMGLARTFQIPKLFKNMTVLENVLVPMASTELGGAEMHNKASKLLKLVGLTGMENMLASELSGGQQKLLEIARALITDPKVVLMDEPLAGVHPNIKETILSTVRDMKIGGTSFLIVSHDMKAITSVSDKLVAMNSGKKIAEGVPSEVTLSAEVIESYLGV